MDAVVVSGPEQGDAGPRVHGSTPPLPLSSRYDRPPRWLTSRDGQIVRWVGRIGAVTVDQVASRFDLGRSVAYERVAACVEAGLLSRVRVLHRAPAFLVATRAGLRLAGLTLPVVRVSPALANHHLACGVVAVWLERAYGHGSVLSERELVFEERLAGRALASARVGTLESGAPKLHRPDFAAETGQKWTAVEVELTAKAPRRLERILRAWRRAGVGEVLYVVAPGTTQRALERAVKATRSDDAVRIVSLEDVSG